MIRLDDTCTITVPDEAHTLASSLLAITSSTTSACSAIATKSAASCFEMPTASKVGIPTLDSGSPPFVVNRPASRSARISSPTRSSSLRMALLALRYSAAASRGRGYEGPNAFDWAVIELDNAWRASIGLRPSTWVGLPVHSLQVVGP